MSAMFGSNNTNGSTFNQGNIFAGRDLHFGNNNTSYREKDDDSTAYIRCQRRLLRALPYDPNDHRDSLITRNGRWLKGTCEWILKTRQYMDWLDSDNPSQLLWITGDPGKGKTMLSLFLISHREAVVKKDPERRKLVHFFCGAQDGRNTGLCILRSLIYQLLAESQGLFDHIRDAYAKHGRNLFEDDRFETLWKVFDAMIRDPRLDSVTCILDGLDECDEESLSPLWVKIRNLMLPQSPKPNVHSTARLKIVLTSRNYPGSFEHYLHYFPRLKLVSELNDEIRKEVEKYIDHCMEELECSERKKPKLHQLRANVKRKLVNGSSGTYLWVNFAIDSFKKEACPELEAALDKFPRGLDGMYRRMFLTILPEKRPVVISILRWVATSFRPLTLEALGVALSLPQAVGQELDDAVQDFVNYAESLLLVVRKDPKAKSTQMIVIPVHASMTDFLWQIDGSSGNLAQFHLDLFDCHNVIAKRSLDYIMSAFDNNIDVPTPNPDDAIGHPSYQKYPLFEYALTAGLRHLVTASKASPDLSHPLIANNNFAHQRWLRAQCLASCYLWLYGKSSMVHVAALLGNYDLLAYYVGKQPDCVHTRDEHQRTPLFYAALREHGEIVSLLLIHNADPNAADFVSQTSLHIACATQCRSVVSKLLAKGADTSILSKAHGSSHGGKKAGSMLDAYHIDDDSSRDTKDHTTGTALHIAAEYNHHQIVEMLLSHGAHVNAIDSRGRTSLHRAALDPFHAESAKLLIAQNINMLVEDERGETAFHTVVYSSDNDDQSHEDMLTVMLRAGFPVDLQSSQTEAYPGRVTPLQIASRHGKHTAVDRLIKHGANVNALDDQGQTALHWLAGKTQDITGLRVPEIARQLLESMNGSSIFAINAQGHSALDTAIDTSNKLEKKWKANNDGDRPEKAFVKSWLAGGAGLRDPVHEIISSYMHLIRMPLAEESAEYMLSKLGVSSEKDVVKMHLLLKQREEYRSALGRESSA